MRQETRNRIIIAIGVFGALLVATGSIVYREARQLFENSQWVAHTQEVVAAIESLRLHVSDAESGQRGYLITGQDEYLLPYRAAVSEHREAVDRLQELTVDNPEQQSRAEKLEQLISARFLVLQNGINKFQADGFPAVQQTLPTNGGRETMQAIRALSEEIKATELDLLTKREAANEASYLSARFNIVLATLVGLLALAGLWALVQRHVQVVEQSSTAFYAQRELLKAMLISIGDGVIATDEHGRITLLNAVAERLTAWSEADALGKSLETVFHIVNEETRQNVENPALRALRDGEIVGLANHTILIARDGTEWPLDDSAAPIKSKSGEIRGAILVFREISERKEQENELREQAAALAEADQRKTEFLATLAHELRNPLAPISNALQLWPFVERDTEEVERLRMLMERQVRQMTRLIDDLMDVSRIARGKIQLHKQRLDLIGVLSEAVDLAKPLFEAAGVRVTLALPQDPLYVEGDVSRLAQVFGNVLNNAAKFTGRDGVVWITAEKQDENATITVRDSGQGIPPHMLSDIFEMFRQADGSLERAHGGLGIGLTLVKRLIEEHRGTVIARSEGPGKGSEFVITLPLVAAPASALPVGAPRHSLSQINHIPGHRVLVVDDIKASAHTLAMMLRALGQEVYEAYSGPAGIEEVDARNPDLVFLDIAMPEMSGYEVARRLRAKHSDLVLAAVTGYGQEDDRRAAFEAGFNHHLVKPTSMEALERILLSVRSSKLT